MAKKTYTFRFSEEVKALITKLAELENRSEANLLEVLIREKAKQLNITAS